MIITANKHPLKQFDVSESGYTLCHFWPMKITSMKEMFNVFLRCTVGNIHGCLLWWCCDQKDRLHWNSVSQKFEKIISQRDGCRRPHRRTSRHKWCWRGFFLVRRCHSLRSCDSVLICTQQTSCRIQVLYLHVAQCPCCELLRSLKSHNMQPSLRLRGILRRRCTLFDQLHSLPSHRRLQAGDSFCPPFS